MIWADRVGVMWMIFAAIASLGVGNPPFRGDAVFWIGFGPWMAMRALDWIFSGEFRHHFW